MVAQGIVIPLVRVRISAGGLIFALARRTPSISADYTECIGWMEYVTPARCQAKTPPFFALVAQLDRASDYESGGCPFESFREYEDFIGGLG